MGQLDEQFGVSDKEIESLMKEADKERDSLEGLSEEDLKAIQERKEKVVKLKNDLSVARNMQNKQWAESIIKASVENAVIGQHLAISDLEDDFQSKKVASLSELTNAITSGASELVKLDQQDKHLEIAQEKNRLRRAELNGDVIDTEGSSTEEIKAIGTGPELLKALKSKSKEDINKDIMEDSITEVTENE